MKSLVVFYSRTGATRKVARAIASELQADLEEVVDARNRTGLFGYLSANWDAALKRRAPITQVQRDPSAYDLVVIGTPIWNWGLSSPMRTYLFELGSRLKRTACFCTMGGNGEAQLFVEMQDLCRKPPLESCAFLRPRVDDGSYVADAKAYAAKVKSHFGVA